MGMTGSFTLRSLATVMRDLAIHLARWNIILDAPAFCISLGEAEKTIVFAITVVTCTICYEVLIVTRYLASLGTHQCSLLDLLVGPQLVGQRV